MPRIFYVFLFLLAVGPAFSQEFVEDITKFFEFELGKEKEDSTHYSTKLVISPIVSYEPVTSVQFGIGSKLLFKLPGAGLDTRTSNFPFSLTYTLRNQFIYSSDYTVFFNREKYLLMGSWEMSEFPYSYFGIGSRSKDNDKIEITYDQFLLEPVMLRNVFGSLFLGAGLRYNINSNAALKEEHENQSLIDSLNFTGTGLQLAMVVDSRDNVLNALEGYFIDIRHGFYGDRLGGNREYQLSRINARKYLRIKEDKLHVIAFEFFSRFSWGNTPVLDLPALGGKELLRGFQEGRFRDQHCTFFQSEFRWQSFERIGFVFFTGAGQVFNSADGITFQDFKYSIGSGLRVKIVKSENLNIRLDYGLGFGPVRDNNFYIGIAEAF